MKKCAVGKEREEKQPSKMDQGKIEPDSTSYDLMIVKSKQEKKIPASRPIPFTSSEHYNPSHDVPKLHKTCQSPDFEALKLGKGRSGCHDISTISLYV